MSADIRRYLNGEQITAQPATAWTKVVKWAGRHPFVSTAAACFLLGLGTTFGTAAVSGWFLYLRPDRLELRKDGRSALLLTYGQRELHEWSSPAPGGIVFARLLEQSSELGGGKLAILGYSTSLANPFPGQLCAFPVEGDRDKPIWRSRVEKDDIPQDLLDRGRDVSDFHTARCWIEDVFKEIAGDELVVVFSCTWSQRCVRIYDSNGNVRYQFWQDGGVHAMHWMSDAALLVFAGLNEELKLKAKNELQLPVLNVPVLFAVRPELDFKSKEYLIPSKPKADGLSPVCYRYVLPLCTRSLPYKVEVRAPTEFKAPGRFAHVLISLEGQIDAGLGWIVDEFGDEAPRTRVVGDPYIQDQSPDGLKLLPRSDAFKLCDDPPPELD